jgi:FtsP/CotA-like multicopper oxidase with cupredoxin domain
MTTRFFAPTRREVLAGLTASAAGAIAGGAVPSSTARLALEARPATLALKPAQPATAIWELAAASPGGAIRLRRGDQCEVALRNNLPVPLAPAWYGLDGASAAEPILASSPITPGQTKALTLSMTNAGTLMADLRLFEDALKLPFRPLPIVVQEAEPLVVDRDELFLVEDWRLDADGAALRPGAAGSEIAPIFTINGKLAPDFTLRQNERLRLRLINGCQRAVIAVKFEGVEVLVMALDSRPLHGAQRCPCAPPGWAGRRLSRRPRGPGVRRADSAP